MGARFTREYHQGGAASFSQKIIPALGRGVGTGTSGWPGLTKCGRAFILTAWFWLCCKNSPLPGKKARQRERTNPCRPTKNSRVGTFSIAYGAWVLQVVERNTSLMTCNPVALEPRYQRVRGAIFTPRYLTPQAARPPRALQWRCSGNRSVCNDELLRA
jgi:hypothetical protein